VNESAVQVPKMTLPSPVHSTLVLHALFGGVVSPEVQVPSAGQVEPGQSTAWFVVEQTLPTLAPPAQVLTLAQPIRFPTPASCVQNEVRAGQVPPRPQSKALLQGIPGVGPPSHHPTLLQMAGVLQPKALTFDPPGAFDETS
jgi:hypothetical protein